MVTYQGNKMREHRFERTPFIKILNIFYYLGIIMHVFSLVLFYLNDIHVLVLINSVIPLVFLACIYLNNKKKILIAAITGILITVLYSIVCVFLIGWASGYNYYLILVFFIIFYFLNYNGLWKVFYGIAYSLLIVVLFLYTRSFHPVYAIKLSLENYLHIHNLITAISIICIFILLYNFYINYIEDELHEKIYEMQLIRDNLENQIRQNRSIQLKLVREKALLDALMNNLPEYIYFKDKESKFIRISESMLKLFQVSSIDEMIGKSDFDFQPFAAAKKYFDEEQEIYETGKGYLDHIVHEIMENGVEQWVSTTKMPLFDETGKCIGTFGITKNITSIKKLEVEARNKNTELNKKIKELQATQEELKYEKSLMDALLNNVPDHIYFKDFKSRFTKVSLSQAKLFGSSNTIDLIGKSDFDFFDDQHAQPAYDDEQMIIKTGQPLYNYVEKEVKKDGTLSYVNTSKMPLYDTKGKIIGTYGISTDITEKMELQMELKLRNDELQAKEVILIKQEEEQRLLNEQKTKFFSIFSHDLKNPLNSLLGFTELLWINYDKYEETRKKRLFGEVYKLVINIKELVLNLLEWSRSQLNNLSVKQSVISIKDLLMEAVLLYELQQKDKNIKIELEINEEHIVLADEHIVKTVFRNIISNSIKYSHPGGSVTIRSERKKGDVCIHFSDTGIGMSKEEINALFKLQGKQSKDGTLNEKGTGVGLIVCKEYLEKCNGSISIKSSEGKGSTFIICLPGYSANE